MAQPIKRNGIYWVRKKVPDDLRAVLKKREEKFSLRTRDPAEAKVLFAKAIAEIEERWSNLRRGRMSLTPKQAWGVAGEVYREFVEAHDDHPEKASLTSLLLAGEQVKPGSTKVSVGGANLERANAWYQKFVDRAANPPELKAYLDRRGWVLDDDSMQLVLKAVREAMLQGRRHVRRYQQGDWTADPKADRFPELNIVANSADAAAKGPVLSDLIGEWVEHKIGKGGGWKDKKIADDHEVWARRFAALVGDRPVSQYTKADGRTFQKALKVLPPNYTKKVGFKGLSFPEAVELANKSKPASLSVSSVNKIIGFLSALWGWLDSHYDDVPRNPFVGQKLDATTAPRQQRTPFRPHELQAMFKAPLYTGCRSETAWRTPGNHIPYDTAIYWVPLIGLYTGARSGEIIQLLASDIKVSSGVLHFDMAVDANEDEDEDNDDYYVHEGPEKSFKTPSSIRRIPVHSMLINLGFSDFVSKRAKTGSRLFPEMPLSSDGRYSTAYSPRFGRFLTSLRVKRKKNAFHSFRHNFEDACRRSRIPLEAMNALQGHSQPGMAGRYGDGDYGLQLLNEEMQKFRHDDLDLSHLMRR